MTCESLSCNDFKRWTVTTDADEVVIRGTTVLLADSNHEVNVAPKIVVTKPPSSLGLQLVTYFKGVIELDLYEGGRKTVLC